MHTGLLRFRGGATLAAFLTIGGLYVGGCGAYQAHVDGIYPPGAYIPLRIDAGTSGWGHVLAIDRCLSGWNLQLHLLVGERRLFSGEALARQEAIKSESDPDDRVSMVVVGNTSRLMPWAEGDVFLVLEGGVEDAAVAVPCGSEKEGTVIGLYSAPDKSDSQITRVRPAFVDQQGKVVPGADEFGDWPFGPYCYPNCPPESPLVTLPSRAPCLDAPNIDPCSIPLNVGEGVRLRVETSDIVWLRIHELDPPDEGLPLVRLSVEQLEPSPDGFKNEVRVRATLYPAGTGNESVPGWRPGASAATVSPWRAQETLDAPVYFDLLGQGAMFGKGAITAPGPGEGWLLVLESLDGSAEFEVTAERVAP